MVATPSARPSRLRCPVRHLRDHAQQRAACAAGLPTARAGTRSGPCPAPSRSRRGSIRPRTRCGRCRRRARRDSRARPGITTCSASLFGIGYCAIGDPFITMRSSRRRLVPAMRGRIGHHQLRDHAVMPGDQLAAGVESGLDVMRGHRAELSEGEVVLAAPDQLHRLADGLGQPHRVEDHLLLAAAAETATEHMLMQRDLRAIGLQQARHLVEQAGCALRAGPDLRRLAVGADRGGRAQRLHLRVIDVARAVFAAEHLGGARHGGLGVALGLVGHAGAAVVASDRGELLERALTSNTV